MSSQYFRLDEHTIEASHIRSFPRALSTHENDRLQLAIKQYTPLNNLNPQDGDITIIGAHANAFPKVYSSIVLSHKIKVTRCPRDLTVKVFSSPSMAPRQSTELQPCICIFADYNRNCMNLSGMSFCKEVKALASKFEAFGSQT